MFAFVIVFFHHVFARDFSSDRQRRRSQLERKSLTGNMSLLFVLQAGRIAGPEWINVGNNLCPTSRSVCACIFGLRWRWRVLWCCWYTVYFPRRPISGKRDSDESAISFGSRAHDIQGKYISPTCDPLPEMRGNIHEDIVRLSDSSM